MPRTQQRFAEATRPMPAKHNQAQRLYKLFGNAHTLYLALEKLGPQHRRSYSAVTRWAQPRSKGGTGGIVPTSAWPAVKLAAKASSVALPDDIYQP